MSNMCFGKI